MEVGSAEFGAWTYSLRQFPDVTGEPEKRVHVSRPIDETAQGDHTNPNVKSGPAIEGTQATGERIWPGWSAPMLGAFGAAIAGVFIAADPRFPFSPVQSGLGGAVLGALAGLIVWLGDRRGPAPNETVPLIPPGDGVSRVSRVPALSLLTFGLTAIVANHLIAITLHKKIFALVLGGPVLVGFGLASCLYPSLLTGKRDGGPPSLWVNLVAALFGLAGLGLAGYMWFVMYR
jgi:hypothetical protein